MKTLRFLLILILVSFFASMKAQTTSTIVINTTTVSGATSLADAITKSGIAAANVTSVRYTSGSLTGSNNANGDWETIKTLTALGTLVTDAGVTVTMGTGGMPSNSALKSITFNELATTISFSSCANLESVSLPKATNIGVRTFQYCTKLTSVNLPKATTLEAQVFDGCTSLKELSLPSATSLANVFSGSSLEVVSLNSLTEVSGSIFVNCSSLKKLVLPKVQTFVNGAFSGNTNLKYLYLGSTVPTSVGSTVFGSLPTTRYLSFVDANGAVLSSSEMSSTIANYKAVNDGNTNDYLWYGWTLDNVKISGVPETIHRTAATTTIKLNDYVQITPSTYTKDNIVWEVTDAGTTGATFSGSTKSLSVTNLGTLNLSASIKDGNETIHSQSFSINVANHLVGDIFIVDNVKYRVTSIASNDSTASAIGQTFTQPTDLNISKVTDFGETFTVDSIGDNAFKEYGTPNHFLTSATFPNVVNIGKDAFRSCLNLKSATFAKAVMIGEEAFMNANVESVDFPEATTIGASAFTPCAKLKTVFFPKVTSIGKAAFRYGNLTSATFPDLREIGESAFFSSNIKSLSLGSTVPKVVSGAFNDGLSSRNLTFVDANGKALTAAALSAAIKNYKADAGYNNPSSGLWYGWTIQKSTYMPDAAVTLSGNSFEVADTQLKPTVISVVLDGETLVEGTDYKVSYGANNKVGTGTVTVTGIGAYSGSKTVTFTIEPKKYTVTLPVVKNAATNPGSGSVQVEEGKDFVFTVTPEKGYTAKVMTDQGETLYPYDGNHYMIVGLKCDVQVYIDIQKSTSAEGIEALNVWSKNGNVIIASPETARVYVVNIVGQIAKATTIPAGTTTIGRLSAGVYIVKVGTKTAKVVVR